MLNRSQFEIETELKDCFRHKVIREIHIRTGIGEAYLGNWLNPNNPTESPAYRQLQIQAALDEIDPAEGERHFQRFCRIRNEALAGQRTTPEGLILAAVSKVETELADIRQHIPQIRLDMRREVERKKND